MKDYHKAAKRRSIFKNKLQSKMGHKFQKNLDIHLENEQYFKAEEERKRRRKNYHDRFSKKRSSKSRKR